MEKPPMLWGGEQVEITSAGSSMSALVDTEGRSIVPSEPLSPVKGWGIEARSEKQRESSLC